MYDKVLFLDIDGVVNCRSTTDFRQLWSLDPYMAFLVGKIQLDTGCAVVLSSSWRYHPDGIAAVEKNIVDIIDTTPLHGGFRGAEVKEWLSKHPEVTRYAILDDESDFYSDQCLFKTSFQFGLTKEIADAVTAHLSKD